jgi:ATP synthase protein I
MLKPFRSQAYELVFLQIFVVLILFFYWLLFHGLNYGFGAILGGLACIIPNLYFINKVFSDSKRTFQKITVDFYFGEFVKIFLSALLLVLILKFTPVKLIPTITGYIGAYMSIWLVPLLILIKDK